jgi:hypothetical protein
MSDRGGKLAGFLAVLISVFGGIGLSMWIALRTFWWCPKGGCSLVSLAAKVRALGNVVGVSALLIVIALMSWFLAAAVFRIFSSRLISERVFLAPSMFRIEWYYRIMRWWIALLWGQRETPDA